MKRQETNSGWKMVAIFSLVTVGMLGLMAQPVDNMSNASWMGTLIVSKAIGVGAWYAAMKLAKMWFNLKFNY